MNANTTSALQLLLGAGGLAFVGALWKAIREWREGSWKRRDSAVADLERWRDDNDRMRRKAEEREDEWRGYAGDCENLLRINGIPIPPSKPVYKRRDPDAEKVDR